MAGTLLMHFLTQWLHTELRLVLEWIVSRLMLHGLLMEFCLLYMIGRDLQRLSGNSTAKVGLWSSEEIKRLRVDHASSGDIHDQRVPTIEDSLMLVSSSVQKVILDAKVGPPLYEKEAAKDILSVVSSYFFTEIIHPPAFSEVTQGNASD
ncbi:hypothetical protein QQ045_031262 [Rhodiola kirilowii]